GIHYPIPCHMQPAFKHLGYKVGNFPYAESLSREILSLPMFPGLTDDQIHQVVSTLKMLLTSAQPQTLFPTPASQFLSTPDAIIANT
ncbi:MAG TPA: DegT/DnrJ/EryC1/StrS family aminotransferase, partial [Allocoleopsis sp.]